MGDFGLVTALSNFSDDAVEDKTKDANLSILTSNVGTQLYMSPEQVSNSSTCGCLRGSLINTLRFLIN